MIDQQDLELTIAGRPSDYESWSITYDADRTPYISAQVTVPYPGAAIYATWDPRDYPKVTYVMTRRFSGSDRLHLLSDLFATVATVTAAYAGRTLASLTADFVNTWTHPTPQPQRKPRNAPGQLYIRSCPRNHDDDTVTLTLSSGEVLMDDKRRVAGLAWNLGTVRITDLVTYVLAQLFIPDFVDHTDWAGGVPEVSGERSIWQPGQTLADFLEPELAVLGLRLYWAEDGVVHLAPTQTPPEAYTRTLASAPLTDGTDGTITRADSQTNIGDDWFDAAVVTYKWTTAAGVAMTKLDIYPPSGVNRRAISLTIERPFPGYGYAQQIVRRSLKRGSGWTVTAVTDLDIEPGRGIYPLTLAGETFGSASIPAASVMAVTYDLPSGEMTLTLPAT